MNKWPKQLPPLSPEDQKICDDFMEHWHDVFPSKFGIADRWSHEYVSKNRPATFHRTVEIGAGLGEHLTYETLTDEQAGNYVCVEFRENMASRIRERFPKIKTHVGDCQKRLDFEDGYFDRVVAIHVLEHLPNLPETIKEMHRLCDKKTGTFAMVIPCEGSMAYSLAREISAKRIFQKRYKRPYDMFIKREHINLPWEVLGEIEPYFEMIHSSYWPIPVKFEFCNLFIGAMYKPKAR